jgi:hypothetical protein
MNYDFIKELDSFQLIDLLKALNEELSERNNAGKMEPIQEDVATKTENAPPPTTNVSVETVAPVTPVETVARVETLKTEDLGKTFEMGICLLYNTPYDGKYKYSMTEAEAFRDRLQPLKALFPECKHTAKGGALYDFTSEDATKHLSAKTTKGDCKIAPQYIGQATPHTFCERIGIPKMSDTELKQHIQENITTILPHLEKYTFSSPIIYYNKKTDVIQYITRESAIPWSTFTYSWTKPWSEWSNSSTLSIETPGTKKVSILEIQFHTKRSNMAIRWCFEKLLAQFPTILRAIKL